VGPPEGALPTTPAGRTGTPRAVATDADQRGTDGVVAMNAECEAGPPAGVHSPTAPVSRFIDTRTLQAFMGHRSIANTVVYTAVADMRIRNIWGK